MIIELETTLVRGGQADAQDVRALKRALNCIGFYIPDKEKGMTGEAGPDFWDSLYAYQRARAMPFGEETGADSLTERFLNEDLAALDDNAVYVWRTVGDDKVRGTRRKEFLTGRSAGRGKSRRGI